jgi:hypothetical protein
MGLRIISCMHEIRKGPGRGLRGYDDFFSGKQRKGKTSDAHRQASASHHLLTSCPLPTLPLPSSCLPHRVSSHGFTQPPLHRFDDDLQLGTGLATRKRLRPCETTRNPNSATNQPRNWHPKFTHIPSADSRLTGFLQPMAHSHQTTSRLIHPLTTSIPHNTHLTTQPTRWEKSMALQGFPRKTRGTNMTRNRR